MPFKLVAQQVFKYFVDGYKGSNRTVVFIFISVSTRPSSTH